MFLLLILLAILAIYTSYQIYKLIFPSADVVPEGKFVLITGCDTGFGHNLAIELDRIGFNVFATIYNSASKAGLEEKLSPRATVFRLDITKEDEIEQAYGIVQKKTDHLYALVNNAGVDQDCLIDWISMDFIRSMMEVNYYGHVMMTKRFIPLLITKRNSRVVNVTSVAGILTAPFMTSYCSAKHALEAFSDCLRREMSPWGLKVSIVEPGYMQTPIIHNQEKFLTEVTSKLSPEIRDRWGNDYIQYAIERRSNNQFLRWAENPNKVVQVLKHAVINTEPKIRYRPGLQSTFVFSPLSMLPSWLTDFLMKTIVDRGVRPAGVIHQID